ncbi:MAG: energy-coupled thiamine transporter ThiT [Oscillospiraceae bacterium]|nr:energy-coupled thiamine transporter ThiT [Oscillospiraceae bacterium]MBR2502563.1 energy-coupled thiamine transporter ThiT [Oscillospiraceae bacterium]
MSNKRTNTRAMVECALMIAVGTVLAQIKLFTMPYGGSVTLVSSLPFILVSFRHGTKWGLFTGFANSLLQMLTGFYMPPAGTLTAVAGSVLLDYILAFMSLGLACAFSKPFKNRIIGVAVGSSAAFFLRLLCSISAGALLWGSYQSYYEWAVGLSVWEYSIIYNASYMIPEMIITTVAAVLVASLAPDFFKKQ